MQFSGKTILLTGASSGIGYALAKQLDRKNARLILIARRQELLQQLQAELSPEHQHLVYACDVGDHHQVVDLAQRIKNQDVVVDGLILNAGVSGGFVANPLSLDRVQMQFATNFWGVIYFIEQFLPEMLARKAGFIAGVGSLAGCRGMPGAAGYSASKAALARFLESLRIDLWGSGVRVYIVSPGFVKTPLTDQNKFRMPFIMTTEKGAQRIIKGLEQEKPEIHFPYRLSVIAKLSNLIPDDLYAWLMSRKIRSERKL